jgi:hypothetical protein
MASLTIKGPVTFNDTIKLGDIHSSSNYLPLPIDFIPLNRYLQAMTIEMRHYDTAAQGVS